ncbi:serine hydrolase domain-containing protein [Steroidobacter sp.]|uniref:serine hydrolase domain-containing protein n=1 Tax=Steroidobacter sp. TaxID=1978227 RepID=UPI001A5FC3C7|nr:serine hydrolase domain-containing protein [Steroidobacter sp.]MBL8265379.1 beta-lactamase family protein [Steroidobacter sp.]
MSAMLRLVSMGLLCMACVTAEPADLVADDRSRELAVDAVFAEMQRPDVPGAAVGIYRGGRLIYSRGYGIADIDHKVPVTTQTVFNLASVSKQFTAFSVALLAREGKLDLQADIRKYLPDIPDFGERITVADLVHHRSGLRNYRVLGKLSGHDNDSVLRQQHVLNLVRSQRALSFPPGTRYEYSNTGYVLLAEIVKAVSGKSLGEFMRERIFAPLGMKDTRLRDDLKSIEADFAVGYELTENGSSWRRALYNRETSGPGNMLSTVGDLAKWAGHFMNPVLVDRAFIQQLSAPNTLRDGTSINYGFGLQPMSVIGHRVVMHGGGVSGYRSIFMMFPDDDFAIVLLANHLIQVSAKAEQLARIYLEPRPNQKVPPPDMLGRHVTACDRDAQRSNPAAPSKPSSQVLAAMAGTYRSEEIDTTYTLSSESGRLTLHSLYLTEPQLLTPTVPDRFKAQSGPLQGLCVTVERDAVGRATALLFDVEDLVLRLPRN